MTPAIDVHPDPAALFDAAAVRIGRAARAAIEARGRFAIALAGGSTPKGLYARIADGAAGLDVALWRQVHFFWGDERTVPPDHADSNFRMAREAMLDRLPVEPGQIHRMRGEHPDPSHAAHEYEVDLVDFFDLAPSARPHFDLVLLGIGPDGHTASLFPGTTALREMDRLVVSNYVPKFGVDRLTLTAPTINHAHEVVFLVEGASKAATVRAIVEGPRDPDQLPAQMIQPGAGTLTWMIDMAAAAELGRS